MMDFFAQFMLALMMVLCLLVEPVEAMSAGDVIALLLGTSRIR